MIVPCRRPIGCLEHITRLVRTTTIRHQQGVHQIHHIPRRPVGVGCYRPPGHVPQIEGAQIVPEGGQGSVDHEQWVP